MPTLDLRERVRGGPAEQRATTQRRLARGHAGGGRLTEIETRGNRRETARGQDDYLSADDTDAIVAAGHRRLGYRDGRATELDAQRAGYFRVSTGGMHEVEGPS